MAIGAWHIAWMRCIVAVLDVVVDVEDVVTPAAGCVVLLSALLSMILLALILRLLWAIVIVVAMVVILIALMMMLVLDVAICSGVCMILLHRMLVNWTSMPNHTSLTPCILVFPSKTIHGVATDVLARIFIDVVDSEEVIALHSGHAATLPARFVGILFECCAVGVGIVPTNFVQSIVIGAE
jgi:hypothetical protein